MKQAPQVWYQTIADFFKKLGLERLELDYGVFVSQDRKLFLGLYVDDSLLFASDESCFTNIQDQFSARFKMTNLGEISHYLGMEVDVKTGKILLRQTTYLKKILGRFQMIDCKPSSIPMNLGVANFLSFSEHQADRATINGISQQLDLLYCLLYIIDPISPIQWELLVGIAQILAP